MGHIRVSVGGPFVFYDTLHIRKLDDSVGSRIDGAGEVVSEDEDGSLWYGGVLEAGIVSSIPAAEIEGIYPSHRAMEDEMFLSGKEGYPLHDFAFRRVDDDDIAAFQRSVVRQGPEPFGVMVSRLHRDADDPQRTTWLNRRNS